MVSAKIASILSLAAFVAGTFVASPDLRAFAANTIGSADIINESIQSVDIKNSQIKTADLASSSVTSSKIASNTILGSDVSPNFIKQVRLEDGMNGWQPDEDASFFTITDSAVIQSSVVIAVSTNGFCEVADIQTPGFRVECTSTPIEGAALNYVVINK
jgi:hypothetical protein